MNSLKFEGKGFEFFKIHFINVIVVFFSLTILYPWAKVREIKYMCQNTFLAENTFTFTGTTSKFFKGYYKILLLILCLVLFAIAGAKTITLVDPLFRPVLFTTMILITTVFTCFFVPVIVHGSLNFRLENTSWGNIKPSYTGKLSKIVPLYFIGMLLTSLTFGIYKAWFQVKLLKYILQNIRFGSLKFNFSGSSQKLFLIYLKGVLLCLITFGIYGIWFAKELYEYTVNNIVVKKDDQEFNLHSNANTLEVFEMMVGNLLLIVLTLGIGASWAYMRYYNFIINHCIIPTDFNINSIEEPQEEEIENVQDAGQNWLDKWNPVFIA